MRFFCAAELARRCIANGRKGAMLHLVSKRAEQSGVGLSASSSAAGGLATLSMSLAVEWGRDNLRSNLIVTRLMDETSPDDVAALRSLGNLSAYYCSDYGSYITGSCIGIDDV
jgi:NAD(P)-dependent dehydrogenase (short-subunit alcohol dehydrogenase family)